MYSYNQLFRDITLIIDNESVFHSMASHECKSDQTLIISKVNHKSIQTIRSKDVNHFLGQEFKTVAYDAKHEFNPNAFAAICGCIVGGGNLIVHLPLIYHSILSKNKCDDHQKSNHFLLYRFVNRVAKFKTTRWSNNAIDWGYGNDCRSSSSIENGFDLQQSVIHQIKRCCLGHAKRPLIITADRGRGKSTVLGVAAAELIIENNKNILVVSPRKQNVNILMKHAENTLLNHSTVDKIKKLRFVAPDQLINEKPLCDFLIIDEAGAIPVQILEKIIQYYNRIIFSTTVNGYEGNGQGFKVRFKLILETKFPQYRSATLIQPMRWANNDPLEESLNESFMLNPVACNDNLDLLKEMPNVQNNVNSLNHKLVEHKLIEQKELINNEHLLKEIYSLLVEAHYQTRPSDLERLVCDPQIKIFISSYDNKIISAALISIEGNINLRHCKKIDQGKLRLAGQLLPQALIAYQGDISAGELTFWRVMRIAVKSHFLRNNVATQLIVFIEKQAINSNVDMLGASFSMSPLVMKFWYSLGYNCTRIALSKDSSTGSTPAEFLKTIKRIPNKKDSTHLATKLFNESFNYSVQSTYKELDPKLILIIIENQLKIKSTILQKNTLSEVNRYTEKARSYEMVSWHINQLILFLLSKKENNQKISEYEKNLIISKSIQSHHWDSIIKQFNFEGTKTAKEAVRKVISKLVSF